VIFHRDTVGMNVSSDPKAHGRRPPPYKCKDTTGGTTKYVCMAASEVRIVTQDSLLDSRADDVPYFSCDTDHDCLWSGNLYHVGSNTERGPFDCTDSYWELVLSTVPFERGSEEAQPSRTFQNSSVNIVRNSVKFWNHWVGA